MTKSHIGGGEAGKLSKFFERRKKERGKAPLRKEQKPEDRAARVGNLITSEGFEKKGGDQKATSRESQSRRKYALGGIQDSGGVQKKGGVPESLRNGKRRSFLRGGKRSSSDGTKVTRVYR